MKSPPSTPSLAFYLDWFGGGQVISIEDCAQRVVYLFRHPELAEELGREGREHIKQNFLLPRLVRDELALIKRLMG